jgi:hypothetical protein
MSGQHCVRHLLAQGAVAQVEYCMDCGVVHLSMESITVRFRPAALRDVRDTLSAALASLRDGAILAEPEAAPAGGELHPKLN